MGEKNVEVEPLIQRTVIHVSTLTPTVTTPNSRTNTAINSHVVWQTNFSGRPLSEAARGLTYDLALKGDAGRTILTTVIYPMVNRFSVTLFELVPELLKSEVNVPYAKTNSA